jgi:hypothetical protein
MARAQLQGTNLGSTSGGRKILASVHTQHLCLYTGYYSLLTTAGTTSTSASTTKIVLLSEEFARYIKFIDWMAKASDGEEGDEVEEKDDIQHLPKLSLHIFRVASLMLDDGQRLETDEGTAKRLPPKHRHR